MNTINERIEILLSELNLNKTAFANKLNVKPQYISKLTRTGNPSVRLKEDIYRIFNVNPKWLEEGSGDIFLVRPDEDEVAVYVYSLLQEENPLNDLIIEIMRTYNQLDESSQQVFNEVIDRTVKNIQRGCCTRCE